MKRTFAILVTLCLCVRAPVATAGIKSKQKEKRYDLVTLSREKAAEGNYRGIEDSQILELRTSGAGFVATLRYRGTTAPLSDVRVTTRTVAATVNWPDGRRESLQGRFVNRVRNGVSRFGLLIAGLQVSAGDSNPENIFFEHVSP